MDILRRRFLRGNSAKLELRPPWLLNPGHFTEACTRCGKCSELCPQQILRAGDGGFPQVDFRSDECIFCGDCATACEANLFGDALYRERNQPWNYRASVGSTCLAVVGVMCRSCEDACEPGAIGFPLAAGSVPQPVIALDKCTGCGACVGVCPESAIAVV